MKGSYGGGHGMGIMRVPGRKPMEAYRLRKPPKKHPELWNLAGKILAAKKKPDPVVAKRRKLARQKIAESKTAYMVLDDDKPIGNP